MCTTSSACTAATRRWNRPAPSGCWHRPRGGPDRDAKISAIVPSRRRPGSGRTAAMRPAREDQPGHDVAAAPAAPQPGMTRGLTLLFAVAGGAAVGNLYWAQPLLDFIAHDLRASPATAGWLITASQLGYAAGILLIVPLGDVRNRQRLIPVMMICAAAALVACALAPSIGFLFAAITVLGLTTVGGQILAPLAGDLADDAHRGRVVGIVVSGILSGILVSRTIVLGATGFGLFTMFWTSLTFLLSAPPFSYPVSVIGLFGLAGLAGAIAAQRAGRLHDRGWSLPATGAGWALALAAFIVATFAGRSVAGVLVAVVLLDIAVQGVNILNQTRLFALSRQARSRLNTAFVTGNFIGGAIGSAAAALLWSHGGWTAVTITGAALSCFALAVWAAGRRGPLVPATPR